MPLLSEITCSLTNVDAYIEVQSSVDRKLKYATKREDSMVVLGHCPCNLVYHGTREYCSIGFGMPVTMSMEVWLRAFTSRWPH